MGDITRCLKKSLSIMVTLVVAVNSFDISYNPCESADTSCQECIRRPSCAWCSDPNFGYKSRCFQPSHQSQYCGDEYVWNPNNLMSVEEQLESTNTNTTYSSRMNRRKDNDDIYQKIQITPQKVKLQLRERVPYILIMNISLAEDRNNERSLRIIDNAPRDIIIEPYTRCSNSSGDLINTNRCDKVLKGDIITFELRIELLKCPSKIKDYVQSFQIYTPGLLDSLFVNLEMLCSCACEHPGNKFFEENSPKCKGGTYKCGICHCHPDRIGRHCECSSGSISGNSDLHTLSGPEICKTPGTNMICSGRGQCICGNCECDMRANEDEIISGVFCECDNFSCERHNGLICSGPDHGQCICGTCLCRDGWNGIDCSHKHR